MKKEPPAKFELRLYVASQTAKSLAALANLKRICETHLAGEYSIEVIDLTKNPALAVPTLVRRLPEPADPEDHRRPFQRRACARGPGCATGGGVTL